MPTGVSAAPRKIKTAKAEAAQQVSRHSSQLPVSSAPPVVAAAAAAATSSNHDDLPLQVASPTAPALHIPVACALDMSDADDLDLQESDWMSLDGGEGVFEEGLGYDIEGDIQ